MDTDMCLQGTMPWELCYTIITFVGFSLECIRTCIFILPLRDNRAPHYPSCRVSPQCGNGYVSSNCQYVRTVLHTYHICRVSRQCGYGHVSSNCHFWRIVLHTYHICKTCFSPVWIRTCFFKLPLIENCAPHVSHL